MSIFSNIIGTLLLQDLHAAKCEAVLDGRNVRIIGAPPDDLAAHLQENHAPLAEFLASAPEWPALHAPKKPAN